MAAFPCGELRLGEPLPASILPGRSWNSPYLPRRPREGDALSELAMQPHDGGPQGAITLPLPQNCVENQLLKSLKSMYRFPRQMRLGTTKNPHKIYKPNPKEILLVWSILGW